MRARFAVVLATTLVFGLVGCTRMVLTSQGRRDLRIKRAGALFKAFSPEIQAKIRRGQIDIGFTEDMVHLALGSPRYVYTRETKDGLTTIWRYVRTRTIRDRQLASVSVEVEDAEGDEHTVHDSVWVNADSKQEYTTMRIEFMEMKVVAIERLQR